MAEIKLENGGVVLVSDADLERLSKFKWSLSKAGYVVASVPDTSGKSVTTLMHRFILGLSVGDKVSVRRANKLRLDNRRENLSKGPLMGMCSNTPGLNPTPHSTTGTKGVFWCKRNRKWRAQTAVARKSLHIGYFDSEAQAHESYLLAQRIIQSIASAFQP